MAQALDHNDTEMAAQQTLTLCSAESAVDYDDADDEFYNDADDYDAADDAEVDSFVDEILEQAGDETFNVGSEDAAEQEQNPLAIAFKMLWEINSPEDLEEQEDERS